MNTTLLIYIWSILDNLTAGLRIAFALLLTGGICMFWFRAMGVDCNQMKDATAAIMAKIGKRMLLWSILTGIMTLFIPSSNSFAVIVIAPKLIESDVVQKDMPELYEAAKVKLMESLKK